MNRKTSLLLLLVLVLVILFSACSGWQNTQNLLGSSALENIDQYISINTGLVLVSLWILATLIILPWRMRRWQKKSWTAAGKVFTVILTSVVHFGLPLLVWVGFPLLIGMPLDRILTGWRLMLLSMPDFTVWLLAASIIQFVKGIVEIWQVSRAGKMVHHQPAQSKHEMESYV